MTTKRENIVQALVDRLTNYLPSGAQIARNPDAGDLNVSDIPAAGYVAVFDVGAAVRANVQQVMLGGGRTYTIQMVLPVECFVTGKNESEKASRLDDLLEVIATALPAGHTLGGLVDDLETDPVEIDDADFSGVNDARAALFAVRVVYDTDNPLN